MTEKVEFQTYPMDAKWRLPFRYVWGVAATALSLLFTALLAPVAFLAARAHRVNMLAFLEFWAQGLIKICRVKVEVVGVENIANLKSGVIFSNHQSFFDVFAMLAYMPPDTRFVAKKELLKVPAFGYALERSDHVVIDRDGGGRQIQTFTTAGLVSNPLFPPSGKVPFKPYNFGPRAGLAYSIGKTTR